MLDERIQEIHEHVAIILEREIDTEDQEKDDFEKQVRVFHHWNASGHFINAAELALKIGGQLMLLGLNSQSILLFDDVLNTLKDSSADQFEEMHGGKILLKLSRDVIRSPMHKLLLVLMQAFLCQFSMQLKLLNSRI